MFMNMITKFSSKERRKKFMHRAESNMDKFPKEKLQKKCLQHKLLSIYFHKILQYQISRKSFQWVPRCYKQRDRRTEGQRNMTKLICAFLDFTNAYSVAYTSFLSLSLEIFMSDLKNNSRTIELSHTPAISYLNI
jgi:hypothetical protein